MEIKEILQLPPDEIVRALKVQTKVIERPWSALKKEYEPAGHAIMDKTRYPDRIGGDRFTRITYDYQRLAVKRMTELCFGIPVVRESNAEDENELKVLQYLENIFLRSRIDSVNLERGKLLFASCEVMTLWYAIEEQNSLYGFDSPLKLRCKNFSPMYGDVIYTMFDKWGDLVSLSVEYSRYVGDKLVLFFDTYTKDKHFKFRNADNKWEVEEEEDISIGKIPAIYMFRPTPIWEDTTKIVDEIELAMSLNGNYLKKNSKPIFAVFSGDDVRYEQEKSPSEEDRAIFQFPTDAKATYITWSQAIDNLKFYITELRQSFFTQLQLPDWSYESMKSTPMSGESRKQLFVDAMLKVQDESGRILEFLDREVNVVRAFMKVMLPTELHKAIDSVQVNSVITPYSVTDESDTVKINMTANGGKPILSQFESITRAGISRNPRATYEAILKENAANAANMAI